MAGGAEQRLRDKPRGLGRATTCHRSTGRRLRSGPIATASRPLAPTFGSIAGPGRELELGSLSYPFQGTIDEVRIYNGAPPPAWFTVEFANLADRTRFMQIGAEEAR